MCKASRVRGKGDQLVVTRLDRLGRSLEHLIELIEAMSLRRPHLSLAAIMKINELHTITADVVETARTTLVIGAT
ncbi:recombinase family protein [Nocardia sp. NPDC004260]